MARSKKPKQAAPVSMERRDFLRTLTERLAALVSGPIGAWRDVFSGDKRVASLCLRAS